MASPAPLLRERWCQPINVHRTVIAGVRCGGVRRRTGLDARKRLPRAVRPLNGQSGSGSPLAVCLCPFAITSTRLRGMRGRDLQSLFVGGLTSRPPICPRRCPIVRLEPLLCIWRFRAALTTSLSVRLRALSVCAVAPPPPPSARAEGLRNGKHTPSCIMPCLPPFLPKRRSDLHETSPPSSDVEGGGRPRPCSVSCTAPLLCLSSTPNPIPVAGGEGHSVLEIGFAGAGVVQHHPLPSCDRHPQRPNGLSLVTCPLPSPRELIDAPARIHIQNHSACCFWHIPCPVLCPSRRCGFQHPARAQPALALVDGDLLLVAECPIALPSVTSHGPISSCSKCSCTCPPPPRK